MIELPGDARPREATPALEDPGPGRREPDGLIMQEVKKAYWSHVPVQERRNVQSHGWTLPADFIPDLIFAPRNQPDAWRSMDLWQRAMRVYVALSQDRSSRLPAPSLVPRTWLVRANQCGEEWKKKSCPLSLEGPVPQAMVERLAAQVRIPVELFLPQTLFGWLLAWRVFEPDRATARLGMYNDLASTTDWGKYSRGELEDWHAIAIADIRIAQQGMPFTAAVRHILMAKKCSIMARHRNRCITGYSDLGVPVLAEAAEQYPSANAMICEWYALDMGLPTIADQACVSDAGRAYFSIAKMVNDIHDLAIDTYTGDVGNGARLYGDARHGTDVLVTWLVGLGHLAPAVAAKVLSNSLTRNDRTFLAGCAGVSYTFWGHRSDLWPVLGRMAQKQYGWGSLSESECPACGAAPRCGACFYMDVPECTHLHRASFNGSDTDAAEIVNAALDISGAKDLIGADSTKRAIARLAKRHPRPWVGMLIANESIRAPQS